MMHGKDFLPADAGYGRKAVGTNDIACDEMVRKEELLPFAIRPVHSQEDLDKAVRVRHTAYARHVPEIADRLKSPELLDYSGDACVLLAESKLDGSPLGSVRIQVNANGPLLVEQSVSLPDRFRGWRLAEATRLAVEGGRLGRLAKLALIKACLLHCRVHKVDAAIAAGRAPVDRQYEELMFEDLFPESGYIPLKHAGNLPHRIMAFDIHSMHQRWSEARHPLLAFFCHTIHPDIQVKPEAAFAAPDNPALQPTLLHSPIV